MMPFLVRSSTGIRPPRCWPRSPSAPAPTWRSCAVTLTRWVPWLMDPAVSAWGPRYEQAVITQAMSISEVACTADVGFRACVQRTPDPRSALNSPARRARPHGPPLDPGEFPDNHSEGYSLTGLAQLRGLPWERPIWPSWAPRPAPMTFSYRSWSAHMNSPDHSYLARLAPTVPSELGGGRPHVQFDSWLSGNSADREGIGVGGRVA